MSEYDYAEPSELDIEAQMGGLMEPTKDDIEHLESDHNRQYNPHLLDPSNPIRRRIIMERAVIRRAVTDILAAGYSISIDYGEDELGCNKAQSLGTVMAAIGASDMESLYVYRASGSIMGCIMLVYGNNGWDVMADYSLTLEGVLQGASKLAEELSEL